MIGTKVSATLIFIEINEENFFKKDKIGFEAPDDEWTESKELYDLYKSANEKLIYEKIINNNYQNRWKIIVASHYLF